MLCGESRLAFENDLKMIQFIYFLIWVSITVTFDNKSLCTTVNE